ncbi:hypothetical protein VX159_10610 [Dechloromonas sp. ZY10]|uniref:hypothetical protein n=1 Tax=Dechloromonas aquae TaxID=2664436 RepID=UPI0035274748
MSVLRFLLPRLCGVAVSSLAIFLAGPLVAEEAAFTVQGFATLGATRSNSRELEFVRDLSQPRGARREWTPSVDSVAGVQADWRLAPELSLTVQAVSRYRHDRSYAPELAWAFLRYEPTPALTWRAGRLGTDFFMLADSRLIGYSYLTVRPAGDFFWHLPFSSIDGVDLVASRVFGSAVLRGKLFYGAPSAHLPLAQEQWKIAGSPMAGGYLDWQQGSWQWRAGYAALRFSHDLPLAGALAPSLPEPWLAEALAYLKTAGRRSDFYSLGAVYDDGPWQAQLMVNRIEQQSAAFESSYAASLLLGRRFGAFTPYLGYSLARSSPKRERLNPVVDRVLADSHVQQGTATAGLRWDLARHTALKFQWDGIRAASTSLFPFRDDPATGRWSGRMNVYSVTLDYVFR